MLRMPLASVFVTRPRYPCCRQQSVALQCLGVDGPSSVLLGPMISAKTATSALLYGEILVKGSPKAPTHFFVIGALARLDGDSAG